LRGFSCRWRSVSLRGWVRRSGFWKLAFDWGVVRLGEAEKTRGLVVGRTRTEGDHEVECASWQCLFVEAWRLGPDRASVSLQDTLGDRQPQSRSSTHEVGLAAGMERWVPHTAELLEDTCLIFGRDADPAVCNRHLDKPRKHPPMDGDLPPVRSVFDSVAEN